MSYRVKARYYAEKDNFGESYIITSDNRDVDSFIEVGDLVAIDTLPVCATKSTDEQYPDDWARVDLMVSPDGEMHAIGGEREHPNCDSAYVGLERIQNAHDAKFAEIRGDSCR